MDTGCAPETPSAAPRRALALIGLPPDVADPVRMLAEILGWRIIVLPAGPVVRPAARLCLAMQSGDGSRPPWAVWSPDAKLNEHISAAGLSNLDHPPCLSRLESLLELVASSMGPGLANDDACQGEQDWSSAGNGAGRPGGCRQPACAVHGPGRGRLRRLAG